MKHLLATAAVVIGLGSWPAAAEDPAWILGIGAEKGGCGELMVAKSDAAFARIQWVLGYISGVNSWTNLSSNITSGLPNISVFMWVQNHCREHPLEQVAQAVNALIVYLLNNNPPSAPPPAARVRPIPPPARSTLRPPDELR